MLDSWGDHGLSRGPVRSGDKLVTESNEHNSGEDVLRDDATSSETNSPRGIYFMPQPQQTGCCID